VTRALSRRVKPNSLWHIFRWPIAIAAVSTAGLLSALIGDGWADVLSWFLLGALIAVMVMAWMRGR
jgi:hypothetical protein